MTTTTTSPQTWNGRLARVRFDHRRIWRYQQRPLFAWILTLHLFGGAGYQYNTRSSGDAPHPRWPDGRTLQLAWNAAPIHEYDHRTRRGPRALFTRNGNRYYYLPR